VPVVVRIGPGIELGWLVAAVGVGMDVVGWYQVSGQPTEAQQLPYLASATIPGAALIVAGAVLIAGSRRATGAAGRRTTGGATVSSSAGQGGLWAVPDGGYLHRGDCPLLDGKPEAYEVTAAGMSVPGTSAPPTRACPVCEPEPAAAP
jgi:hypothetical protein